MRGSLIIAVYKLMLDCSKAKMRFKLDRVGLLQCFLASNLLTFVRLKIFDHHKIIECGLIGYFNQIPYLVESTTTSRVKDHTSLFADLNDLGKDSDLNDKDFVKHAFNILTGAAYVRNFRKENLLGSKQFIRYHFWDVLGICVMHDHDEKERCLQTIWYNMDSGMTW